MSKTKSETWRWVIWLFVLASAIGLLAKTDWLIEQIAVHRGLLPAAVVTPTKLPPPTWPIDLNSYQSQAILLYDLTRQEILLAKNIDQAMSPASLVKIMTVVVALENLKDYDKSLTKISSTALAFARSQNAATAGFSAGQLVTYLDLLYAAILPSGAEAALTLAELVAGSEAKFVDLMNEKAAALNLCQTVFRNSTGLDAAGQTVSARDIVKLLRYALKNPLFRQIFTAKEYRATTGLVMKHTIWSQVDDVESTNFQLLGGKSGTTPAAGLCWSTLNQKNGREFLLVTLGAPLDKIPTTVLHQKSDWLEIMRVLH